MGYLLELQCNDGRGDNGKMGGGILQGDLEAVLVLNTEGAKEVSGVDALFWVGSGRSALQAC